MHKFLIQIILLTLSLNSLACPQSIYPQASMDNNLENQKAPANSKRYLSQRIWNEVLDEIEKLYSYLLSPSGVTFRIDRYWNNLSANATVKREGNLWQVIINGGYTISPHVNADVIARVACHEIGHHLGGTAFNSTKYSWSAVEGQADYYATLKCLRKYFKNKDNESAIANMQIPSIVSKKCEAVWERREDALICIRSSMAAKAWTKVMYNSDEYNFNTPSTNIVKTTIKYHPDPQCRLDTQFQGALCSEDHEVDTDITNHLIGTCNENQYEVGLRPRCWYSPI